MVCGEGLSYVGIIHFEKWVGIEFFKDSFYFKSVYFLCLPYSQVITITAHRHLGFMSSMWSQMWRLWQTEKPHYTSTWGSLAAFSLSTSLLSSTILFTWKLQYLKLLNLKIILNLKSNFSSEVLFQAEIIFDAVM